MSTTLNDVQLLCQVLKDSEQLADSLEESLKFAKERVRYYQEEAIPTAMQEIGLTSATLETGEKLTIKQDVYASIAVADREIAYEWLETNGFGGLIKIEVAVAFGRDESDKAENLVKFLLTKNLEPTFGKSVNAQTLKAFLREQIAAGSKIPLELFGARPVWVAKLSKK